MVTVGCPQAHLPQDGRHHLAVHLCGAVWSGVQQSEQRVRPRAALRDAEAAVDLTQDGRPYLDVGALEPADAVAVRPWEAGEVAVLDNDEVRLVDGERDV